MNVICGFEEEIVNENEELLMKLCEPDNIKI